MSEVTQILSALEQGDPSAAAQLLPLVYEALRQLAVQKLAHEKPGQTLQATALVHEAYLRLVDVDQAQHWNSRRHFFAAAAEAMRRILVEQARRKSRHKHGGGRQRVSLEEAQPAYRDDAGELRLATLAEGERELRIWRLEITMDSPGRDLIQRCPQSTRARYRTLIQAERSSSPADDYGLFIDATCSILEAEFRRLLTEPSRAIAQPLITVLRPKQSKQAEILERWGAGEAPSTLVLHSILLMAMKEGLKQTDKAILEFLGRSFKPRFIEVIRDNRFATALEVIRTRYRNPIAHGIFYHESLLSLFLPMPKNTHRFLEQLGEVLDKAQRIHVKSLGGILALQEKLAEQWAALGRCPVQAAGVGA